jgi:hypothetical protein
MYLLHSLYKDASDNGVFGSRLGGFDVMCGGNSNAMSHSDSYQVAPHL